MADMGKDKAKPPRGPATPAGRKAAVDVGARLRQAVTAHQRNQLALAQAGYEEILRLQPVHFDALHLLGVVALQRNDARKSLALIDRAIEIKSDHAAAWSNRGNALMELRRLDEALASFERAITLMPDFALAWSNRGNALKDLKRLNEAVASCDRAIALAPDYPDAWSNRGNALRELNRPEEALASCDRALALKPDHAEACNNRANALMDLRQFDEALAGFERTVALTPGFAAAWSNRGNALKNLRRLDEALASYERALALDPGVAQAWSNRGAILKDFDRLEEALASCVRAIALEPGYPEAWFNRGNALKGLKRLEEALASYDKALELRPEFAEAHTNKIFLLDFLPGCGFSRHQAERERFHEAHARHLLRADVIPEAAGFPVPLKLGYVSADFKRHSASEAFGVLLRRHDRSRFRLVLYSGVNAEDDVTTQYRALADQWVPAAGLSDEALASRIRADGIHILIDLSGHSQGNRLLVFARKPAPVQITAWGHGTGTGLKAVDYLFADPVAVPETVRSLFAEAIYDLPCLIPYEAPAYMPALAELPALRRGSVTFGCLNRFSKVSLEAIALWAEILKAAPAARMLLKDGSLENPVSRSFALEAFARHGIGAERIELRGHSLHHDHLSTYNEVDIALDPFPQGGGVTTWESVTMGVPVVSKLGDSIPARISGAIMTALGFADWVAADEHGYARIAVEKASDPERLAQFRRESRLRIAASPAGNPEAYTRAVEEAYLRAWERAVQKHD